MKTVLAVVAGFVLVLIGVHVDAQPLAYFSGNDLKQQLADDKDYIPYSTGRGYITGVHDTTAGVSICVSQGVPAGQLSAIVQKYLADHPEQLHIRASDLVIKALSAAFPCRK